MQMQLLVFVLPYVVAFGGRKEEELGACEKCVCKADPGNENDANNKHCCPKKPGTLPDKWDSYCDLLSLDVCKDECYENGNATTLKLTPSETLSSRSMWMPGLGTQGDICYPGRPCSNGFSCVSGFISSVCVPSLVIQPQPWPSLGEPAGAPASSSPEGMSKAQALQAKGIKLLAWDWDMTAHTQHTYGQSQPSYTALASGVSDGFIQLASAWCKLGLPQAIVTYNDANAENKVYVGGSRVAGGGPEMISTTISQLGSRGLPSSCTSQMRIEANNLERTGQSALGKNPLLQSAQSYFNRMGQAVNNNQIVLIDDTPQNIDAGRATYNTIQVIPRSGFQLFQADTMSSPGASGW